MEPQKYPQCRIVPIRMLQPDNAEKFLDGVSYIPGIRRVLVHGPGFVEDSACRPRDLCELTKPSSTEVKIAEQDMKLHVLMGDVIIEAFDEKVFDTVAEYCTDFFDDLGFQILVGSFLKTEPSLSDYVYSTRRDESEFIGLSDYHQVIDPAVIKQDFSGICNT